MLRGAHGPLVAVLSGLSRGPPHDPVDFGDDRGSATSSFEQLDNAWQTARDVSGWEGEEPYPPRALLRRPAAAARPDVLEFVDVQQVLGSTSSPFHRDQVVKRRHQERTVIERHLALSRSPRWTTRPVTTALAFNSRPA